MSEPGPPPSAAAAAAAAELGAALAIPGESRAAALRDLSSGGEVARIAIERDDVRAALRQLLADPDRTEQRRAADALAPLLPLSTALVATLRDALRTGPARLRWGAAYTLGRGLPPSLELWPATCEAMSLEDGDQRWAAGELASRLASHFAAVRDELVAAAGGAAPTLRKMALYSLRELLRPGEPSGLERRVNDAAVLGLRSPDHGVRLAAVAVLAVTGRHPPLTEVAADALAGAVSDDSHPGVCRAAAATLVALGTPTDRARRALQQATAGADPSLARAARARPPLPGKDPP